MADQNYEEAHTTQIPLNVQHHEENNNTRSALRRLDFSYFATSLGRIKMVQLLLVVLTGCFLPTVIEAFFTRFSFYVFVTWTTFLYVLADLIVHVTSMVKKLPAHFDGAHILMILDLMAGVIWLICSSLVASVANRFPAHDHALIAVSCACGFFTMASFFGEAYLRLYLERYNNRNTASKMPASYGDRLI